MTDATRDVRRVGPTTKLIPALGMFSAVMLVAGGVIGSGIFRKAGIMAGQVGSPEVLLAVWLVAGIVSILGT
jgi:APA family basic amino acid/polyamine antiporter